MTTSKRLLSIFMILEITNCSHAAKSVDLHTHSSTLSVPFDIRVLDCLDESTKDHMIRGVMAAEDIAEKCSIDRKAEKDKFDLVMNQKNQQLAEAEGLRAWANVSKGMLVVAIVGGIVATASVIIGAIKK